MKIQFFCDTQLIHCYRLLSVDNFLSDIDSLLRIFSYQRN